jgi:regulator of sigma E protease
MELIGSVLFNVLAMLVTLGILVTFHEFGHFRVARLFGVQVERFSIGLGKVIYSWRGKPDPRNPEAPPTEFAISVLPLGGYVKMLGEQGMEQQEGTLLQTEQPAVDPALGRGAFINKPLAQRAAIIAAGPAANFVLAVFLYWIMFMTGVSGLAPVVGFVEADSAAARAGLRAGDEIVAVNGNDTATWQEVQVRLLDKLGETGALALTVKNPESSLEKTLELPVEHWLVGSDEPNLLGDLGITPFHQYIPAKLKEVVSGGRAAEAGLIAGDRITSANGNPITSWNQWLKVIHDNPERVIEVGIERGQLPLQLSLTPAIRMTDTGTPELDANGNTQGYIGAQVEVPVLPESMNRSVRYTPWAAIPQALAETWDNTVFVLVSMKKMLIGLISLKNLSGPITIAQVAGETASIGFEYYIGFLAVLSVSLGVFNLLPIPVLDGGHLFYYAMEAVLRRPVPRRVQEWGLQVGLMLVASFMFLALYNDVSRLF